MVQSQTDPSKRLLHPEPLECNCQQAIKTQEDYLDRVGHFPTLAKYNEQIHQTWEGREEAI